MAADLGKWVQAMVEVGLARPHRALLRKVGIALAALLFVACIPALWLMARDLIPLMRPATAGERIQYELVVHSGLLDELDRARLMGVGDAVTLHSTVDNPPCFSVAPSGIRPDKQLLPNSENDTGEYDIGQLLSAVQTYAQSGAIETARLAQAHKQFTVFGASALRSCIAATPFRSFCVNHAEETLARDNAEIRRLALRSKVQLPYRSPAGEIHYCNVVPFARLGNQ